MPISDAGRPEARQNALALSALNQDANPSANA